MILRTIFLSYGSWTSLFHMLKTLVDLRMMILMMLKTLVELRAGQKRLRELLKTVTKLRTTF